MAKGSAPVQTTQYNLAPEQRQILDLAMPGIERFAATVPQRYQGSTVAGFDPAQTSGQEMALRAAGTQQQVADSTMGANNNLLQNIWDPTFNPALQGAVDAAIRPITQRYQEVVRPALHTEFQGAGQQFGGSRQAIAESQGARDYLTNVSDTSSKLVNDQYANNLNAYLKAIAMGPTIQAMQTQPALTTSAVGDVRRGLAQQQLDAQISGYNYDQLAPFLQSKELVSLLSSVPGASVTSTGNTPTPNPYLTTLGGAASGASLGSFLGPVGTGVGALGGGLMGFLSSR